MKKLLITIALFTPFLAFGASTLWEFYNGSMPPFSERKGIYEKLFNDGYMGTAEQNTKLLKELETPSMILGATPAITTFQGGTGSTSPSGILYGDSSIRLKTVTIGSNLTFSAGTLSATGGSGLGFASTTLPNTNSIYSLQTENVGIGTTSPYAKLSIQGVAGNLGTLFAIASSSSASTTELFSVKDATTTMNTGLTVDNQFGLSGTTGALNYDISSGVTSADNVTVGGLSFDTDAGQVTWADIPLSTSVTAGTVESMTANIAGWPVLTVYSEANGNAWGNNNFVGIGTTSPIAPLTITASSTKVDAGIYIDGWPNNTGTLMRISTSTLLGWANAFIIDQNGKVGIGTTTPYTQLSVQGGGAFDYLNVNNASATSTFAGGLSVAGTSGLTVLQNGNVGIGTASPEARELTISGGAPAMGFVDTTTGDDDFNISVNGDKFVIGETGVGSRITLDGDGNVGIGTTSPTYHLNIEGAGANNSGATIGIVSNDTNSARLVLKRSMDTGAILSTGGTAANDLRFDVGANSGAMYIANTGNVGIGTTTPAAKLSVNQGSTGMGFYLAGYSNNTSDLFRISTSTASATSTAFVIDSQGRLGIGTTTPSQALSVAGNAYVSGVVVNAKDKNMVLASSTLSYMGAFGASGTTTILISNPTNSNTLMKFYCKTNNSGTTWVGFGNGLSTTTEANCSSSGVEVIPTNNNTWASRANMFVEIGRSTGSLDTVTITASILENAQ